jgi:outer membrane protein insertion porin family/translocation and assembly module TamA
LNTRFTAVVAAAAALLGCTSIPEGRSAVNAVEASGADRVSEDDILEHIATTKTSRFLGVARGILYEYSVFDRFVLERDLARVERYYRARGFYQARVRAGRVYSIDDRHVRIEIVVTEGPLTYVRNVRIEGLEASPPIITAALLEKRKDLLETGDAFDEDVFSQAEVALQRVLTDHGYAAAEVRRHARVSLPHNYADLSFHVTTGELSRFGTVKIVGLGKIPEGPVRRALDITEGDPYSTDALEDARQAALDLGVFRSVEIVPQFRADRKTQTVVPLLVRVDPADLKAVRLGVGAELDVLRADLHLLTGWEHRNFFGGLRRFSVDFEPGVVFYPTRLPSLQSPTNYLPEAELRLKLEQPGFIEARTQGFVEGQLDIYPVIIATEVDTAAPILGYRTLLGATGARRRFGRLQTRLTYQLQDNAPFTYAGALDEDLTSVLLSYVSLRTGFDLRDNPVQPRKGLFLDNLFEFAGLGGDAVDLKIRPEVRGYVPIGKKPSLALRGTIGLLFPLNYADTLQMNAALGQPPPGVDRSEWVRDTQIVYFRAFFSGGPNSNRGYPLAGVGPHGVAPFLVPNLASQQIELACTENNPAFDARCTVPLGGLTLWEASTEVRFPMSDVFSFTTFCDASDVSQAEVDFRFDRPHLSCGLGGRYGTPVGPIRLDIGYRIPGLQVLVPDVPPSEGDPGEILGLPIAINVGVGEAF